MNNAGRLRVFAVLGILKKQLPTGPSEYESRVVDRDGGQEQG